MRHSEYHLCNGHIATGPWIECRDGAKWGTHVHSSGRLNDRERVVIERICIVIRDVTILNNNGGSPSREHPKENKPTQVPIIFHLIYFRFQSNSWQSSTFARTHSHCSSCRQQWCATCDDDTREAGKILCLNSLFAQFVFNSYVIEHKTEHTSEPKWNVNRNCIYFFVLRFAT